MRNYLTIIWTIIILLLLQSLALAIDNPNKSYFVFSPDGKYLAKLFQTSRKTWIRIHETDGMETVAQWQVPDFYPHTVQFSPHESTRLLLADRNRFLVYDLKSEKPIVKLAQPESKGQVIVSAAFDVEKDHVVWANQNQVYRTNLERVQDRRIATVGKNKGTIKTIVPLSNGKLAVVLIGSNKLLLFSSESPLFSEELNGHRSPLAGVQSPHGKILFSLDENRDLLIWDMNRLKIIRTLHLGRLDEVSKVRGMSMDEPRKHLLIQIYSDPDGIGQRYAIADLLKGIVDPDKQSVMAMSSGNIYATGGSMSADKPDSSQALTRLATRRSVPYKPRRKNSFYDLAKIEADNENFEAALDFIKRIPLNDPQFKQSRELQKRVKNQMEMRSEFDAAMQQYQRGSLVSAKILLENILAKNPDNAKVKRYLSLTESKLAKGVWLKVLLSLLILILLGLLGYLVWKYRETIGKKAGVSKKKSGEESKEKNIINDRREFILRLDETKRMLKKAVALDRAGKYKNKWMEFSGSISDIEKRAKVKDKFLVDLGEQLLKVQQRILKLSPGSKVTRKKVETANTAERKDKQKKPPKNPQQEKQRAIEDDPKKKTKPSYYQVLGVSENATADQIKKAYHKKMQEYHPDKHNASNFNWVKEEAARMTSDIQEAFDVLSNPQKRKDH